jgi:hypothetical protein
MLSKLINTIELFEGEVFKFNEFFLKTAVLLSFKLKM